MQWVLMGVGKVKQTAVVTKFGEFATAWLAGRDLKSSTRVL